MLILLGISPMVSTLRQKDLQKIFLNIRTVPYLLLPFPVAGTPFYHIGATKSMNYNNDQRARYAHA